MDVYCSDSDSSRQDNLSPTLDPAGGIFSSLADMELMVQMMLNSAQNTSVLNPATLREWLRSTSQLWDDEFEMGLPWEIFKIRNTHGRVERLFTKSMSLLLSIPHLHCLFSTLGLIVAIMIFAISMTNYT